MGKWLYRKPEPTDVKGICVLCQKKPQKSKGNGKYKALCTSCLRKREETPQSKAKRRQSAAKSTAKRRRPYRIHVKEFCQKCGFVPEHICQLDVDHIDGDHSNNSVENLQTLCANCHRLKTHVQKL